MKDTILVLTNSEDGVHSDIVISKLLQAGETVFRMDSDRLASGSLQVRFTCNSESSSFEIRDEVCGMAASWTGSGSSKHKDD